MRKPLAEAAVLLSLLCSGCAPDSDDNNQENSAADAQATEGIAALAPTTPNDAQIKLYNKDMVKKAMAVAQCRVNKSIVISAMQRNDRNGIYRSAQNGYDSCAAAQIFIQNLSFSYFNNDDLVRKIKDGLSLCVDSVNSMQLAFETVGSVADNGDSAKPSDVDRITMSFSDSDKSWKECTNALRKIDEDYSLND